MARLRKVCREAGGHDWAVSDTPPLVGGPSYCARCYYVSIDPDESLDGSESWFRMYGCGFTSRHQSKVSPERPERDACRSKLFKAGGQKALGVVIETLKTAQSLCQAALGSTYRARGVRRKIPTGLSH